MVGTSQAVGSQYEVSWIAIPCWLLKCRFIHLFDASKPHPENISEHIICFLNLITFHWVQHSCRIQRLLVHSSRWIHKVSQRKGGKHLWTGPRFQLGEGGTGGFFVTQRADSKFSLRISMCASWWVSKQTTLLLCLGRYEWRLGELPLGQGRGQGYPREIKSPRCSLQSLLLCDDVP